MYTRLAPEYPYPYGLNDVHDAFMWAVTNAVTLGIDPGRIGIAGTSGGGLLASSLVERGANERFHPPIKAQYLMIPVILPPGLTDSYLEFFHIPGRKCIQLIPRSFLQLHSK